MKKNQNDRDISEKCCGNCLYFLDSGWLGTHEYSCMNGGREYHTILFPEKLGCPKYIKGELTSKDLEEARRNITL